jgi:16S rRNA (guanine527-N7)-methyltransferase
VDRPADGAATDRLAEIARAHGLAAGAGPALESLLASLEQDERAPSTVRDPDRAVDVHVADSLAALDVAAVRAAETIADLGSGAGFPGLVLAAALPACSVSLVESHLRRGAYIATAAARAGLSNARVVTARAEEWSAGAATQDVVVARALGPQPLVLEYAAPLLRVGGSLVDWRGRRDPDEEARARIAAGELGLEPAEIMRVSPFAGVRDRHLHVFAKAAPTPARFPRRPGAAAKRPLGGRA